MGKLVNIFPEDPKQSKTVWFFIILILVLTVLVFANFNLIR